MKFFEQINNHRYIYLSNISEPQDNNLQFNIEEARIANEVEDLEVAGSKISGLRSIEVTNISNMDTQALAIKKINLPQGINLCD